MCLQKSVFYYNTVFMGNKYFFLGHDNTTHTICELWHTFTIEFANVLVSVRAEAVAVILVNAKVKRSSMLNDSFIERRQEHMVFIAQLRDRDNQQPVLFTGVATYNGCTMIRT